MNLEFIERRLRLALHHPGVEGRYATDDVRLALREPSRLDLRSWNVVVRALRARGHKVTASFAPAPLATGETWLLLAAGAHGEAWRIRAMADAPALGLVLTTRPLPEFPRAAVEALRALFHVKHWGIPDAYTGVEPRYIALPSSIGVAPPGAMDDLPSNVAQLQGHSLDQIGRAHV